MKKISLIDYNMGNLLSVRKAFEFIGADIEVVSTIEDIKNAEALVLPGVGNFGEGMIHLKERGMDVAIKEKIAEGTPFMGICLGMQLLFDRSAEAPEQKGLGIIPGEVILFDLDPKEYKVPQMGWNNIYPVEGKPLFKEIADESYFYFVHSFYVKPESAEWVAAEAEYGFRYCVAVNKDNVFATQFHPEKSQDNGLKILQNFVDSL